MRSTIIQVVINNIGFGSSEINLVHLQEIYQHLRVVLLHVSFLHVAATTVDQLDLDTGNLFPFEDSKDFAY